MHMDDVNILERCLLYHLLSSLQIRNNLINISFVINCTLYFFNIYYDILD